MNLPFKMRTETDMEKYRAETFWTKEPETIAWIDSFKGGTFVDVGANIGIYSLYCAMKHPKMQVVAFEPHLMNYHRLQRNLKANGLQRVIALPAAIGRLPAVMKFAVPDINAGATGGQVGSVEFKPKWEYHVMVYSLDAFRNIWEPFHYVKIDIDGLEHEVIEGMHLILHENDMLRSVLIEVDPKNTYWVDTVMKRHNFYRDDRFNDMKPHSSERREAEGIKVRNIVYSK